MDLHYNIKRNEMKPLFADTQVKKYSHDEKLLWILKQLIAILNPIILGEDTYSYTTMNSHSKLVKKREKVALINIHPNNIKIAEQIEMPFKDFQLSVDEKEILKFGDDFCYKFPPEQILLILNRNKKVLK